MWIDSKSKLETAFVFSSTVEKTFKCDVYQIRLSRSDTLEDTYAHPNSENPFKCDIHVCFMLFPKYSLENSSDPIMCSYTGKKLFKSNRLQFSQNLCLNKHTVCAFILGRNTTCEWLWKYKGYCVHSFWVKTINIWSRYVNYNYCRAHWPMQNKLYHLKLLFVVKADTDP